MTRKTKYSCNQTFQYNNNSCTLRTANTGEWKHRTDCFILFGYELSAVDIVTEEEGKKFCEATQTSDILGQTQTILIVGDGMQTI